MEGYELLHYINQRKKIKKHFAGLYACDTIPHIQYKNKDLFMIINTDVDSGLFIFQLFFHFNSNFFPF